MEQLLETSELKTRMCHRLVNKVFIFSVILRYLTKCFFKYEIFLEYIVANMKV